VNNPYKQYLEKRVLELEAKLEAVEKVTVPAENSEQLNQARDYAAYWEAQYYQLADSIRELLPESPEASEAR
jgi:hypothetical protein